MRCPYCLTDNDKVIDSRPNKENTAIRRRRMCTSCEKRFTTYEYIEQLPVQIVKKDGRRENFDREKMLKGLLTASRKRSIPLPQLELITDRIHNSIIGSDNREISSSRLGEMIMEELKKLDKVAYIRFASVYREFKDIKEFKKLVDDFFQNSKRR